MLLLGQILQLKLISIVLEKYNDMYDNDIEIDDFDPSELKNSKKINLYEYCYAINQWIVKNNCIVAKNKKADPNIGFAVVSIILQNRIKKIDNIKDYIDNLDEEKLKEITKIIKEITEQINKSFSEYTTTFNTAFPILKKDNQVISFYASIYYVCYKKFNENDIKFEKKPGYKDDLKKLLNNIPLYYLYDNLDSTWSGSGYEKVETIQNGDNKYLFKINLNSFENRLKEYNDGKIKKNLTNIDSITKLFNFYLYKDDNYFKETQDFDHIISKERGKKLNNFGLSSIGNICPMSVNSNRSKKQSFIYEMENQEISVAKLYITNVDYPSKEDTDNIPNSASINDKNKEEITKFASKIVNNRFKSLSNQFTKKYKDFFIDEIE